MKATVTWSDGQKHESEYDTGDVVLVLESLADELLFLQKHSGRSISKVEVDASL